MAKLDGGAVRFKSFHCRLRIAPAVARTFAFLPCFHHAVWLVSKQTDRVSTRLVVVVVVVVVQPDCLPTHVSSVTEPKSHSSLPKHLPLHTRKSLEKVHPATNFTIQSLAASLIK